MKVGEGTAVVQMVAGVRVVVAQEVVVMAEAEEEMWVAALKEGNVVALMVAKQEVAKAAMRCTCQANQIVQHKSNLHSKAWPHRTRTTRSRERQSCRSQAGTQCQADFGLGVKSEAKVKLATAAQEEPAMREEQDCKATD